jgi:hypothetical protein
MALAPHFCMVVWPCKFWLHLPETYDRNDVIMADYFLVALTGMARSWLMNLPEGTFSS